MARDLFSKFWRDQVFVGGGRKFFSFEQPFQALSSTGFLESLTWTCRFLTRRSTLKNAADMGEINFVVGVYSIRIYVQIITNSSGGSAAFRHTRHDDDYYYLLLDDASY